MFKAFIKTLGYYTGLIILYLFVLCLGILLNGVAQADTRLNFHLSSVHQEKGFHERNYGIGIEHDYKSGYLLAGTLINSYEKTAGYAGFGQRWKTYGNLWASVGYFGGIVYYKNANEALTVPAILPEINLGYRGTSLSILYIPKVKIQEQETVPALLFSVKVKL